MTYIVGESKTTRVQIPRGDGGYSPTVEKGTQVFTVVHEKTKLEFAYAYLHRSMAEYVANKFTNDQLSGAELSSNFHDRWISISDRRA